MPEYRITAAQKWEGAPYEVFRSYQPQWHDPAWYHSRYNNYLQLIAGGWYFWEAGYWIPAWGYDESAAYYPYDGPIYVGQNPRPFDQVVADIQTLLQRQGYYRGEIDGLLGPTDPGRSGRVSNRERSPFHRRPRPAHPRVLRLGRLAAFGIRTPGRDGALRPPHDPEASLKFTCYFELLIPFRHGKPGSPTLRAALRPHSEFESRQPPCSASFRISAFAIPHLTLLRPPTSDLGLVHSRIESPASHTLLAALRRHSAFRIWISSDFRLLSCLWLATHHSPINH